MNLIDELKAQGFKHFVVIGYREPTKGNPHCLTTTQTPMTLGQKLRMLEEALHAVKEGK